MDTGSIYRLEESTGKQIKCNARGTPIRPFNPKITGKFNYDGRRLAVQNAKADLGPVELPAQLKPNLRRNYVP